MAAVTSGSTRCVWAWVLSEQRGRTTSASAAHSRTTRKENEDQKVTLKDQQSAALQHTHTPELCVLCAPPPLSLPSGLPLVNMVLFTFFSSELQKTSVTVFRHVARFSANQLTLSETFQDLMQTYRNGKMFQEPTAQGFFNQTKKNKSIWHLHFQTFFFFNMHQNNVKMIFLL